MKGRLNHFCRLTILASTAILLAVAWQVASAADSQRIAVMPFKINADKDMSFLQDGIFEMLSSRLSREGRIEVLPRKQVEEALQMTAADAELNESLARDLGKSLNADHVLFGSLTILGESISIDSKMVNVAGNRPTMAFFDQGQDLGSVITKINALAEDINIRLFGQAGAAPEQTTAPAQPSAAASDQQDIHAHPEKLMQSGAAAAGGATASAIVRKDQPEANFGNFWRSASFKEVLNGVALGDIDRDGKIETVILTPQSVMAYRSERGKFYKAFEIVKDAGGPFIGIDVADINGNGYPEIFVSGQNTTRKVVQSSVFEYDGDKFVAIVENSSWLYRVVDLPDRGQILLGQQITLNNPYRTRFHELIWQNSGYEADDNYRISTETSIMGIGIGDVIDTGQDYIVAYSQQDYIHIFDPSGKRVWKSGDQYGGSMNYFVGKQIVLEEVLPKQYLPMRIICRKNPASKKTEVIAAKNQDWSGRKLEYRVFRKANITSLSWSGLDLSPDWETREITGYISDIAVGDYDNDGSEELVASVVMKSGEIVTTTPKSTIIAYEIAQ